MLAPLVPPDAAPLAREDMGDFYQANLKLFYARYLTQRRMYDEALEVFEQVDPQQVVLGGEKGAGRNVEPCCGRLGRIRVDRLEGRRRGGRQERDPQPAGLRPTALHLPDRRSVARVQSITATATASSRPERRIASKRPWTCAQK